MISVKTFKKNSFLGNRSPSEYLYSVVATVPKTREMQKRGKDTFNSMTCFFLRSFFLMKFVANIKIGK